MKCSLSCLMNSPRHSCYLALALVLAGVTAFGADASQSTFASPEAAVAALASAVQTTNRAVLHEVFGPMTDHLVSPDAAQAANEFAAFAIALNQTNNLVRESETRCVLEVGVQAYPFPVPLVQSAGRWSFDTTAGCEELRNRRVGRNELATLQTVRAYMAAQREYASRDHDGSGVLKYAQRILSSPGKKDGLFWPANLDGEISPMGPLVARAQLEGPIQKALNPNAAVEPYQGYYFRILTRQGRHAPGGSYHYVINGNMIGGFALVAWPAYYGETGIMTFIVNQQGRVYQKDLGRQTAAIASKMKAYDPDPTWRMSRD